MNQMWNADEDSSLKSLILFGMRGMAAYAYHALMLGKSSEEVDAFFVKGFYRPSAKTGAWMNDCHGNRQSP